MTVAFGQKLPLVPYYYASEQGRFWRDYADAQARLKPLFAIVISTFFIWAESFLLNIRVQNHTRFKNITGVIQNVHGEKKALQNKCTEAVKTFLNTHCN